MASPNGLSLGGNIYYVAHHKYYITAFLICFNLLTEQFNIISLPEEIAEDNCFHYPFRSNDVLVAFKDKLAIARDENREGAITVWTLEDATTWSKQGFHIPPFREGFGYEEEFRFIGTARKGELIFAPQYGAFLHDDVWTIKQYVVYYDPITNTTEMGRINEEYFRDFPGQIKPFLDHIENPALSKIGLLQF
ncbi:PREDICTED: putative F-box protein At1g31000 [Camelina sativa]|uniref:F-box protein At1g31000 n=1 Tax=Camelina sativa TaxID=90675 RepID=A0ABM0WLT6_CAMSA|nr:PREDICTED: putative F-box protein At1g31000 [Camelina sativa]